MAPPPLAPEPARTYRNAEGQKWGWQGEMPAWLQRAVNAGQSAEHFRVG
ncbi:H-NS family nucleoid-associated regulatory protein [Cupriavidus basilensis]